MLAAVTCFFNPAGYQRIQDNYILFRENLSGVDLFTIELSFNGEFIIPDAVQIHGTDKNVMWQKERLLNILIEQLPEKYDKVAWLDADLLFENENWAEQADKLLDTVPIVQLFDKVYDTTPQDDIFAEYPSTIPE